MSSITSGLPVVPPEETSRTTSTACEPAIVSARPDGSIVLTRRREFESSDLVRVVTARDARGILERNRPPSDAHHRAGHACSVFQNQRVGRRNCRQRHHTDAHRHGGDDTFHSAHPSELPLHHPDTSHLTITM